MAFFYWENDDNPLGLGMFGVSCFQTKPLQDLPLMPRRTASTQPTPGTSVYTGNGEVCIM